MSSSFLTISSSFAEIAEPYEAAADAALLQRLVTLGLLRATYSRQAFHQLTNNLIRIAEHSIALRDMQTLTQASEILVNLALPEARQAGTYYRALVLKRRGQTDDARTLLENLADRPNRHRARAMQTLGVMSHEQSDLDQAGWLYLEAMRAAAENDLISAISPRLTLSAIKSASGDHRGALADLEDLLPLTRLVAQQQPFFFYVYHNALAVELGEVGCLDEANSACAVALASPFATAYPEWSETRDEIAAKRTAATPSIVAVNKAPQAAPPSPQPDRQNKPNAATRLVTSGQICNKIFLQRALESVAAVRPASPNDRPTQGILEQVRNCIGPRAPPATD